MKRSVFLTVGVLCLTGFSIPSVAQTDPADAWSRSRNLFLKSSEEQQRDIQTRGSLYRRQTDSAAFPWWQQWASDQPYHAGNFYAPPSHMGIATSPDQTAKTLIQAPVKPTPRPPARAVVAPPITERPMKQVLGQ